VRNAASVVVIATVMVVVGAGDLISLIDDEEYPDAAEEDERAEGEHATRARRGHLPHPRRARSLVHASERRRVQASNARPGRDQ
jgi:hypothetical protein